MGGCKITFYVIGKDQMEIIERDRYFWSFTGWLGLRQLLLFLKESYAENCDTCGKRFRLFSLSWQENVFNFLTSFIDLQQINMPSHLLKTWFRSKGTVLTYVLLPADLLDQQVINPITLVSVTVANNEDAQTEALKVSVPSCGLNMLLQPDNFKLEERAWCVGNCFNGSRVI